MLGYREYSKIKQLDDLAAENGFSVITQSHHGNALALIPAKESHVIYSRDAVLVMGSVEELIFFIVGWRTSRTYLNAVGACDTKRIERKEQDYRNKNLVKMIKTPKFSREEPPF